MNNEEHTEKESRRHGPPGMHGGMEKPKNLKKAIKRLTQGLKDFKLLILVSLILAAAGSILAIFTPNIIKDLTDEISKGLVVNSKNLELVTKEITTNFSSNEEQQRIQEILNINLSNETVITIMQDSNISQTDKKAFQDYLTSINKNQEEALKNLTTLPNSILEIVLKDSTYQEKTISTREKIDLLNSLKDNKINISENLQNILLKDITIKNQKITSKEQIQYLSLMSSLQNKKDIDATTLYKKIDKMPLSIKKLIEPNMNLEYYYFISNSLRC